MHIKGPSSPFVYMPPVAEPNSKESASAQTNGATPDAAAHPAPNAMPSSLRRSAAYLLLPQFAAGPGLKRASQQSAQGKGGMPANSGAAMLDPGLTVATDLGLTHASFTSPLSPSTAITKLFFGTREEKTAAQNLLADFADVIIGKDYLTVAAEQALWEGRRLGRPGF